MASGKATKAIKRPHALVLPINADLEAAFIGSCLAGAPPGNLARLLDDDCFVRSHWLQCWHEILAAWSRDEAPDPATIASRLAEVNDTGYAETFGELLRLLEDPTCLAVYAEPRARELRRLALRRRLIALGSEAIESAADVDDPEGVARYVLRVAEELDQQNAQEETGELRDIGDELEARADAGLAAGMSTGIPDYDRWTAGLHRGEILIIAGNTGIGKTWSMTHMVNALADGGYRVAVFSLEMTKLDMYIRLLAGRIGNMAFRLRGHGAAWLAEEHHRYKAAREQLDGLAIRLYVQQRSMGDIAAAVRQWRPDVFCVDFMQLLDWPPKAEGKVDATERNCKAIMDLTKRTDCAAIVLSQMSREAVRAGRSGAILGGQDAGRIDQMADAWLYIDQSDSPGAVDLVLRKARHAKRDQEASYRLNPDTGRLEPHNMRSAMTVDGDWP